jgi:hypothetical protein
MQEKVDRSIGELFLEHCIRDRAHRDHDEASSPAAYAARAPINVKRASPKASATSSEPRGGVKNRS